jgi:uncharacterized protein YndB with AHSA1/START domain
MGKFEKATGGASDREIKITRFFDAPRELVFRAWSDPAQLCKWWGPRGFTIATKSMDVRTGGAWVFDMRGPDGTIYPNRIVYTEIVPERKVAYEHTGEGETADAIFTAEISFEDEGRGTRVTMHSIFPSAAACNTVVEKYGAIEGGIETLERLADIVSQQSPATFTISREFDAPRAKLFELWIRPEHLGKWFGPKGFELEIKSADIRTGGSSLTRMKSPDGLVIWGKWIIREILPPERLIFIDCFSNESGGLERHPPRTHMAAAQSHDSHVRGTRREEDSRHGPVDSGAGNGRGTRHVRGEPRFDARRLDGYVRSARGVCGGVASVTLIKPTNQTEAGDGVELAPASSRLSRLESLPQLPRLSHPRTADVVSKFVVPCPVPAPPEGSGERLPRVSSATSSK